MPANADDLVRMRSDVEDEPCTPATPCTTQSVFSSVDAATPRTFTDAITCARWHDSFCCVLRTSIHVCLTSRRTDFTAQPYQKRVRGLTRAVCHLLQASLHPSHQPSHQVCHAATRAVPGPAVHIAIHGIAVPERVRIFVECCPARPEAEQT